jgi:restriction system protein
MGRGSRRAGSGYWQAVAYQQEQQRKAAQRQQKDAVRLAQQQLRLEEQQRKAVERAAAQAERDRRREFELAQVAEAERQTAAEAARIQALDGLLVAALTTRPHIDFAQLKRQVVARPFDPGPDGQPLPAPRWEEFAPPPPSRLDRVFGSTRYEQALLEAREELARARAKHAVVEQRRRQRLADAERQYAERLAAQREDAVRHNAAVDRFEQHFRAGRPEAAQRYFDLVLRRSAYPSGFPGRWALEYLPTGRQLVVEYELPGCEVIPTEGRFEYVKSRKLIKPYPRPEAEVRATYERVVSQVALRTVWELFAAGPPGLLDEVVFNGHVPTTDPATGQPRDPYILSVAATRQAFAELVLQEVNPRECLRHLNALVSPHPYDLEPVRPVMEFDLTKYRFIQEIDAIAGLDGRLDLLELTPVEFEHLVRQLFENMGMQAWVTQASRDDGVDAVATNPDPIVGGLCVIQAKRYRRVVETDAVRALAGVMDDKRAAKGIMVTTSWYGAESWAYARRQGRIELVDGDRLKYLLKEHCGLDILIGIPNRPRPRKAPAAEP